MLHSWAAPRPLPLRARAPPSHASCCEMMNRECLRPSPHFLACLVDAAVTSLCTLSRLAVFHHLCGDDGPQGAGNIEFDRENAGMPSLSLVCMLPCILDPCYTSLACLSSCAR